MRLKHIYITKEGEPMANPETEYPTEPIEDNDGELILNDACPNCGATYDEIDAEYQICHLCKFDSSHEAMLAKYHSGLLPFEKQIEIRSKLPDDSSAWDGIELRRDTLIPVDLEVEVVEQWNANGIWLDRPEHRQGTPIYQETKYEYRKVLRIKP